MPNTSPLTRRLATSAITKFVKGGKIHPICICIINILVDGMKTSSFKLRPAVLACETKSRTSSHADDFGQGSAISDCARTERGALGAMAECAGSGDKGSHSGGRITPEGSMQSRQTD